MESLGEAADGVQRIPAMTRALQQPTPSGGATPQRVLSLSLSPELSTRHVVTVSVLLKTDFENKYIADNDMFKNRAPSTLYIRLRPIAWASAFVAQALLTTSPSPDNIGERA